MGRGQRMRRRCLLFQLLNLPSAAAYTPTCANTQTHLTPLKPYLQATARRGVCPAEVAARASSSCLSTLHSANRRVELQSALAAGC